MIAKKELAKKVACVVPTYNAGRNWQEWLDKFDAQTLQPDIKIVIDSSSDDKTVDLCKKHGWNAIKITKDDFNHGGTRQYAADYVGDVETIIFLTQDAMLADKYALEKLVEGFSIENVGAIYGRQLPKETATVNAKCLRYFNYPPVSKLKTKSDIPELGINTAFLSNSFSAYNKDALKKVGGFPQKVIMGEDMYVGANLILNNYSIYYNSEACVYHSHNFTLLEEFKRYFDMGVLHSCEPWILDEFKSPESTGLRYVMSELRYKQDKAPILIPGTILRTILKYVGYRLGRIEKYLPLFFKRCITMQKSYWNR